MAEHTPGPWKVEEKPAVVYGNFPYWITNDEGMRIADIRQQRRHRTLANAKLIAEAPRLLQAARCALADLDGIMDAYDPDGYHPGWATIQELRAVIAKATG